MGDTFKRAVPENFSVEMTFEQRLEQSEGESQAST